MKKNKEEDKMQVHYDIQRSIRTKTRMSRFINLQDFLFVALFGLILMKLSPLFPRTLQPVIIGVNMVLVLFWMMPSKSNHGLKQGQSLLLVLFAKKKTYHAIDAEGNSVGGKRH
ncbi:hypothetical protein EP56_01755 [Listeriaceae bacterium FSL A5-0209]|nr:hypothetical protein EP56_01755 [Listeriaceae bacterium FSL A5-0209]